MTRSFSQKFWEDKNGNVVVWQRPNLALVIWFVASLLSTLFPRGPIERSLYFVGSISIFVWSILELTKGVNYFRRLLGLVVLLALIVTRIF